MTAWPSCQVEDPPSRNPQIRCYPPLQIDESSCPSYDQISRRGVHQRQRSGTNPAGLGSNNQFCAYGIRPTGGVVLLITGHEASYSRLSQDLGGGSCAITDAFMLQPNKDGTVTVVGNGACYPWISVIHKGKVIGAMEGHRWLAAMYDRRQWTASEPQVRLHRLMACRAYTSASGGRFCEVCGDPANAHVRCRCGCCHRPQRAFCPHCGHRATDHRPLAEDSLAPPLPPAVSHTPQALSATPTATPTTPAGSPALAPAPNDRTSSLNRRSRRWPTRVVFTLMVIGAVGGWIWHDDHSLFVRAGILPGPHIPARLQHQNIRWQSSPHAPILRQR